MILIRARLMEWCLSPVPSRQRVDEVTTEGNGFNVQHDYGNSPGGGGAVAVAVVMSVNDDGDDDGTVLIL